MKFAFKTTAPAKAGIQLLSARCWAPAFAGEAAKK